MKQAKESPDPLCDKGGKAVGKERHQKNGFLCGEDKIGSLSQATLKNQLQIDEEVTCLRQNFKTLTIQYK